MTMKRVTVAQHERALVWKNKTFAGVLEPGKHWLIAPMSDVQAQIYDLTIPEFEHSRVDFLVKEKGVNPKRLESKGYGESQPLVSDAVINRAKTTQEKEALHQKNRRTSFRVLSFDFVDPNAVKQKPNRSPDEEDAEEEDEE